MIANDRRNCETQHDERLHHKLSTTPFATLTITVPRERSMNKETSRSCCTLRWWTCPRPTDLLPRNLTTGPTNVVTPSGGRLRRVPEAPSFTEGPSPMSSVVDHFRNDVEQRGLRREVISYSLFFLAVCVQQHIAGEARLSLTEPGDSSVIHFGTLAGGETASTRLARPVLGMVPTVPRVAPLGLPGGCQLSRLLDVAYCEHGK